jgi:hypothetical protein
MSVGSLAEVRRFARWHTQSACALNVCDREAVFRVRVNAHEKRHADAIRCGRGHPYHGCVRGYGHVGECGRGYVGANARCHRAGAREYVRVGARVNAGARARVCELPHDRDHALCLSCFHLAANIFQRR